MRTIPRPALSAMPVAEALTLALTATATAQVASLVSPDETAVPEEAVDSVLIEDREEAMLAYAQCMRDHGIEMDDPQFGADSGRFGFGPGGADADFDPLSTEFQSAMDACGNVLEAMRPESDPEEEAERAEQQLVIAGCMRELGWDFPDPASGGGFGAQIRFIQEAGIDPQDPDFQTDISACQAESGLDFGPPGTGGGVAG